MSEFLRKLPISIRNGIIYPQYFTTDDLPWLTQLIYQFQRFEGQSQDAWLEYREAGFTFKMPYYRGRLALEAIEKELLETKEFPRDLAKIRLNLFIEATVIRKQALLQSPIPGSKELREGVIAKVLSDAPLGLKEQLNEGLQRGGVSTAVVGPVKKLGDLSELPRKLNGFLVGKLMMRSYVIEFIVSDQCRRLVRQAKLRGLVCEIRKLSDHKVRFRISGPLAIFGPTTIYGRSLKGFIPLLFWQSDFKLRVILRFHDNPFYLYLDSCSPLRVATPPQLFDSHLEEKFYLEFGKFTQKWDLLREPEPLVIDERMLFPDFKAIPRQDIEGQSFDAKGPRESTFIEIIGYWTETYLRKKVEDIQLMARHKAIFLLPVKLYDQIRSLGLPLSPRHQFITFKRKIPLQEILNALEGQ